MNFNVDHPYIATHILVCSFVLAESVLFVALPAVGEDEAIDNRYSYLINSRFCFYPATSLTRVCYIYSY